MSANYQQPPETISQLLLTNNTETEIELQVSLQQDFSFTRFGMRLISTYSLVCLEVILGLLIALFLMVINIGAGASILSGIITGALVSYFCLLLYKKPMKPNTNLRKIGQAIVGLTIGISIAHNNIVDIGFKLPILIFTTLLLLVSSFFIGYIYSRIGKIELLSGLLAVTPGNIGVMGSLAAEYGRDVSLITLVQVMRFTAVILIMPAITNVSINHDVSTFISSLTQNLFTFNPEYLLQLFIVTILTLSLARIGNKLKIPAAYLLCSIFLGIILNYLLSGLPFLTEVNLYLPPLVNLVGQIMLGITIGEYWGINPNLGKRTIVKAAIPVALTLLAALTLAGITTL
ncbi:MAG: AbrB family transcriptional regulator, partial [Nostocaceae cyanobacterium]|nr:AbrB family transcriptional regulator [Nostocaceae cyanobacterium]